jgi:hypothetical protein
LTKADILTQTSDLGSESPKYRNKQYLRGGVDVTALQTENFTGDGEAASFTVAYPIHAVPTITVDGVSKTVGLKGIDAGYDWYWTPGENTLQAEDIPLLNEAVVVNYYGEYPLMVVVSDEEEIDSRASLEGNTGLVEDVAIINSARTVDALAEAGVARLSRYGVIGRQFHFTTHRDGLEPGQILTITHADYGLTGEGFLIESVNLTEIAPGSYAYEVNAVEGPQIGDWTAMFRDMADKAEMVQDRLDVGTTSGDILVILKTVDDNLHLTEAAFKTVFPCPLPASTLYPQGGLYPC